MYKNKIHGGHYTLMLVDKLGWPVEQIERRPIVNFIRRLIHGDHYVCHECWLRIQDNCRDASPSAFTPNK